MPSRDSWTQKLRDDEELGKLVAYLEDREVKYKDEKEWKTIESLAKHYGIHEGVLVTRKDYGEVKEERLLAVPPNGLRTALISESHDPITAGHRDYATTTENIRKSYWWKGMTTDVETFCKACILCAIAKSGAGKGIPVGWGIEPPRLACINIEYCGLS